MRRYRPSRIDGGQMQVEHMRHCDHQERLGAIFCGSKHDRQQGRLSARFCYRHHDRAFIYGTHSTEEIFYHCGVEQSVRSVR